MLAGVGVIGCRDRCYDYDDGVGFQAGARWWPSRGFRDVGFRV